ncbi:MAG: PRC-barrel domain-containing protein [Methanomassiliicoccales archaeon]|nr:PRC-barrel domain-containing protein [Methanomassiliicoccales archaeon]
MLKMEDIIGLEIVSSDARIVGMVEGVALDVENWVIPALRIGVKKGLEETIGAKKPLFSTAKILVKTDSVDSVSDTITLKIPLSEVKNAVVEEGAVLMTAADIVGKRVICRKARQIGLAENIIFSPDKEWKVPFIEVRLDKDAIDLLNVKKPLLATPLIKIQTDDIKTIGDMIMLKIDADELRDFLEKKPHKKDIDAKKTQTKVREAPETERTSIERQGSETPEYRPRL